MTLVRNAADGAQMTPAQARVIDPVLTTAARGYRNAVHIYRDLFPRVPVAERGGQMIEFGDEDFRIVDTRRAPGADMQRVQFGHAGLPFAVEQRGLEGMLPVETAEEAQRVPGIDMGMRTADGTLDLLELEREHDAAQVASNPANYLAANTMTLAGNAQWSDDASNPVKNIVNAVEVVRSATGRRDVLVTLGPKVYAAASVHPKVLDQIKWHQKETASLEDLARIWRVPRVICGDAVYKGADGNRGDVWGKVAIVTFSAVGSLSRFLPSWGYGYTLDGTPAVEQAYYEQKSRSWIYPVVYEWKNVIVGKDAGYLFQNVVA